MSQQDETPPDPETEGSLQTSELPNEQLTEVVVQYQPQPPKAPPGLEIHPRRIVPPLSEGREAPDDDPSPPVDLDS